MSKLFVLDTNVLLYDSKAVTKFEEHEVVIPLSVIEELDEMKKRRDDLGVLSRASLRFLSTLKQMGKGSLFKGVDLPTGGKAWVYVDRRQGEEVPFIRDKASSRAVLAAFALQSKRDEETIFVSNDFAARIKAEALGIKTEDYENLKVSYEKLYKGLRTVEVPKETMDQFLLEKTVETKTVEEPPCWNEYAFFKSGEQASAVTYYNAKKDRFEALRPFPEKGVRGLQPLNLEQKCAFDLLLRDDIKLVTLVGQAGTGKTLMAIASALYKVFNEDVYSRILVSRPIVPLGNDIGYLPGTKEEKLAHWMQPIYDNLEFLTMKTSGSPSTIIKDLMESKRLEMEAVTYIRGRSFPKMYIIIDEAQNLTPHEVKTVISRAGKDTKVVLTGDPWQIDNPYLDKENNGLIYTVSRFKGQKLFGHIHLESTERSELASLATELL